MATAKKMVGYVLPKDGVVADNHVVFGGFPGRFLPGEPLSLQQLGLEDESAADALIKDLALPLQKVEMSRRAAEAEVFKGDEHRPSTFGEEPLPVDPAELEALSHKELDALADGAGLSPEGTKAEKAEVLAEAGVEAPAAEAAE